MPKGLQQASNKAIINKKPSAFLSFVKNGLPDRLNDGCSEVP